MFIFLSYTNVYPKQRFDQKVQSFYEFFLLRETALPVSVDLTGWLSVDFTSEDTLPLSMALAPATGWPFVWRVLRLLAPLRPIYPPFSVLLE
jgi:hypothetical protein